MVDLERRVIETEAIVEDLLELPSQRVAVGVALHDDVGREGRKPDVIVQT